MKWQELEKKANNDSPVQPVKGVFFERQKRKSIEERVTYFKAYYTRDFQLTLKLHALSAKLHS